MEHSQDPIPETEQPPESTSEQLDDQQLKHRQLKNAHPVRRLMIFQLKLFFDAFRDLLLSPLSILATLFDWIQEKRGQTSYFEQLMSLGRDSDRRINLFEQHDHDERGVDSVMEQMEEMVNHYYRQGSISAKAKQAIVTRLRSKKPKN